MTCKHGNLVRTCQPCQSEIVRPAHIAVDVEKLVLFMAEALSEGPIDDALKRCNRMVEDFVEKRIASDRASRQSGT